MYFLITFILSLVYYLYMISNQLMLHRTFNILPLKQWNYMYIDTMQPIIRGTGSRDSVWRDLLLQEIRSRVSQNLRFRRDKSKRQQLYGRLSDNRIANLWLNRDCFPREQQGRNGATRSRATVLRDEGPVGERVSDKGVRTGRPDEFQKNPPPLECEEGNKTKRVSRVSAWRERRSMRICTRVNARWVPRISSSMCPFPFFISLSFVCFPRASRRAFGDFWTSRAERNPAAA